METLTYRFGVGTSETGSCLAFDSELEAIAEARIWSEIENETVCLFLLDADSCVIDTIREFNP